MTDAKVRAMMERAEKAPPAPWLIHGGNSPTDPWYRICPENADYPIACYVEIDGRRNPRAQEIADFIASARADIPALCRDLLAAREALRCSIKVLDPDMRRQAIVFLREQAIATLGEEVRP